MQIFLGLGCCDKTASEIDFRITSKFISRGILPRVLNLDIGIKIGKPKRLMGSFEVRFILIKETSPITNCQKKTNSSKKPLRRA